MSHYLVTGAAGFIASKVIEFLLAGGHTVVGLDNMNAACDPRLKEWRLAQSTGHPNFTFHQIDICDRPALETCFATHAPFDGLINLAARAGVRRSVIDPWAYIDTNVTGTLNLLELCRKYNVPKFVLSSTSSLYGSKNPLPFSEDATTDGPLSPYAASKKAAEALCYTYHHLYNLDVTVLRYFTVYGPAGRPDMSVFRFIQWISEGRPLLLLGSGEQSRDFTYIDDIARGTVAALKPLGYRIINLGSDDPVSIRDMIAMLEEKIGRKAQIDRNPMHQADMMATWADNQRAGRLLGWEAQVNLSDGLDRAIAWYRQNRDWASQIDVYIE